MGCTYSKPEIESKIFPDFEKSLSDCKGKNIIITGTTSGTGFVAAATVALKGAASICLLNRQSERSTNSLASLKEKVPGANFVAIDCDLANFDSVKAAIVRIKELYGKDGVDVLCNNAGIMMMKDEATKDGYDSQMQVNHLSHFLLTKELMPLMEIAAARNGEARVVNHSSEARKGKPLEAKYLKANGGKLGGDGAISRIERYHQTKMANALFTYVLADKLKQKESKVKALVAHPGLAATELQVSTGKNVGPGCLSCILSCLFKVGSPQSSEDGSMGILKCMIADDVQNGDFYGPLGKGSNAWMSGPAVKIADDVSECTSADAKELLWKMSEEACGEFII